MNSNIATLSMANQDLEHAALNKKLLYKSQPNLTQTRTQSGH